MAGGPLGVHVPCMVCLSTGEQVKAIRTREGAESDQYRCERGHEFGMDWPNGPATESPWPKHEKPEREPTPEQQMTRRVQNLAGALLTALQEPDTPESSAEEEAQERYQVAIVAAYHAMRNIPDEPPGMSLAGLAALREHLAAKVGLVAPREGGLRIDDPPIDVDWETEHRQVRFTSRLAIAVPVDRQAAVAEVVAKKNELSGRKVWRTEPRLTAEWVAPMIDGAVWTRDVDRAIRILATHVVRDEADLRKAAASSIETNAKADDKREPPTPEETSTPPDSDPHRKARAAKAEELYGAMLAEAFEHETWDSEFTASPHDPWRALERLVACGADVVLPLVCRGLEGPASTVDEWNLRALEKLGPRARVAVPRLLALLDKEADPGRSPWFAPLRAIEPAALRSRGLITPLDDLHTQLTAIRIESPDATRWLVNLLAKSPAEIAEALLVPAPAPQAYLARSRGPMEFVVAFLKHVQDKCAATMWPETLDPTVIPVVRSCLVHPDRDVRRLAANIMSIMHLPDDIEPLIECAVRDRQIPSWGLTTIATHRRSVELLPVLLEPGVATSSLLWLVRTRRCAGLSTPPDALRPLLQRELALRERATGRDREKNPEVRAGYAAALAAELGDDALLDQALGLRSHPEWYRGDVEEGLRRALMVLGRKRAMQSNTALHRAYTDFGLERGSQPAVLLQLAEETFVAGKVMPNSATGSTWDYCATLLLREPREPRAAFHLAWIDRACGARIDQERVDWIRSLGFRDESLLEEVARPLRQTLHGWGWEFPSPGTMTEGARRLEQAGLPGTASLQYKADASRNATFARELERLQGAATAHVARVRAAC